MNGEPVDLYSLLFPVHALIMVSAFGAMLAGMILARCFKNRKWWLKVHRLLGIGGAALGVVGAAIAAYMVSRTTGIHLRLAHSWAGLAALLFVALAPVLGATMLKAGSRARLLRPLHRWDGRLALLAMASAFLLIWLYFNLGG